MAQGETFLLNAKYKNKFSTNPGPDNQCFPFSPIGAQLSSLSKIEKPLQGKSTKRSISLQIPTESLYYFLLPIFLSREIIEMLPELYRNYSSLSGIETVTQNTIRILLMEDG